MELLWSLLNLIRCTGMKEKGWELSFSENPPVIMMSKGQRAIIINTKERKLYCRHGFLGEHEGLYSEPRLPEEMEKLIEFFNATQ
jgi:hypothetical protein